MNVGFYTNQQFVLWKDCPGSMLKIFLSKCGNYRARHFITLKFNVWRLTPTGQLCINKFFLGLWSSFHAINLDCGFSKKCKEGESQEQLFSYTILLIEMRDFVFFSSFS